MLLFVDASIIKISLDTLVRVDTLGIQVHDKMITCNSSRKYSAHYSFLYSILLEKGGRTYIISHSPVVKMKICLPGA